MSHTAKALLFLIRALEFERAHHTYKTACARIDMASRARVLAARLIAGRA